MVKILLLIVIFIISTISYSTQFIKTTINTNFINTWNTLYDEIEYNDYKIAYLQRCDVALKQRQYQTDKYRILFFGKYQDMRYLSKKYPQLVPFLPLKIVVMEDKQTSITKLVAPSVLKLLPVVELKDKKIIQKWHNDLLDIFAKVSQKYEN